MRRIVAAAGVQGYAVLLGMESWRKKSCLAVTVVDVCV